MEQLKNSSAYSVFKNFEKISQIPRCSYDEERISEYIYNFGKKLGFESTRDQFGNVIIVKPASENYKNHPSIALQGHLDMVCEKKEDSYHDFTCDPIKLIIDGDMIHADKTTLGADDGAGVALMMAVLEDPNIESPELECLFTTTEETGMDGAIGLSDRALKSKTLINLDNEDDKMIFIGCAGGITVYIDRNLDYLEDDELLNYEIKVSGLMGGHSGVMIHENRLNAIKLLNLVLMKLKSKFSYKLSNIKGGSKHNAIPSSSKAVVGVKREDSEEFLEYFNKIVSELKDQYIKNELDLTLTINKLEDNQKYIQEDIANDILRLLQQFPHGVNTMDKNLNIVKSSNNLAIIDTKEGKFSLVTSIRSSDMNDMNDLKNNIEAMAKKLSMNIRFSDGYPMWEPDFNSELLKASKDIYRQLKGEEPEVAVIHAGLETGILSEKYPDMKMISIGPNILGAHTPSESLSISSMEFVFSYLKELLKYL